MRTNTDFGEDDVDTYCVRAMHPLCILSFELGKNCYLVIFILILLLLLSSTITIIYLFRFFTMIIEVVKRQRKIHSNNVNV